VLRCCDVCGVEFEARPRQKRHVECSRLRASKNAARAEARASHVLEFIGVDGEGVTYCGNCRLTLPLRNPQPNDPDIPRCECTHPRQVHDYVLLSVGDESYSRSDGGRLEWEEIFSFLYDQFLAADPRAVFVGYYLGYDFAQWVRTMPAERGAMLYDPKEIARRQRRHSGGNRVPFPLYIGDWQCDVLPGRRFKLRPEPNAEHPERRWMYICDVGPFFQRSFLTAIDPADWPTPIVSDADYELIKEGKERRSVAVLDTAMRRYNVAENRAISQLMAAMNEGFVQSGVRLQKDQWFGPGQAAQAWMSLVECPTGEEIREVLPDYAFEAARATYYGGWFETFAHGHVPGVSYEYDEISSYPYTISGLPCLLHGTWSQGDGAPPSFPHTNQLCMVRAAVWGSNPQIGTMLHRTPRGTILRPHHTAGWYWWHELDAAIGAGLIDNVQVHEHVVYDKCACLPPLRMIKELFELRKQVGKNTPLGKALKLLYNSVYGKCAQSVGNPRYSNPIWASLITSWTRTRILDAIATHPTGTRDILMVATDGVYFRTPHPNLPISKDELGKWEAQEKYNLTLFMPGMYWDDKTRDGLKDGQAPKLKSRGVSAYALGMRISDIDRQFNDIHQTDTWPVIDLPINMQIITPGQAIQRHNWELAGHVIQSTPADPIVRSINANPVTKRPPYPYHDQDLIRTIPYPEPPFGPIQSKPYDGTFGLREDIHTDEQEALAIIAEMLMG
jgi:hypothetical protein